MISADASACTATASCRWAWSVKANSDFHLAGQRLAESIGRRYQQPLELLDLRFEALAAALGAPPTSNPVGATRLAGAFLRTFRDADISDTLQPLLFRQYEQELGKVLGDLYGRLNALLVAHRLPCRRVAKRRRRPGGCRRATPASDAYQPTAAVPAERHRPRRCQCRHRRVPGFRRSACRAPAAARHAACLARGCTGRIAGTAAAAEPWPSAANCACRNW